MFMRNSYLPPPCNCHCHLACLLLVMVTVTLCQAEGKGSRGEAIVKAMEAKQMSRVNIVLLFRDGDAKDVRKQVSTEHASSPPDVKREALYKALKENADKTQGEIISLIKSQSNAANPIVLSQLWVNNQLVVDNVDQATLALLQARPEITDLELDSLFDSDLTDRTATSKENEKERDDAERSDRAWGVKATQVFDIWRLKNKGKGVVIGIIDSGVRVTHEALKTNFRSEYGWFDPGNLTSTSLPFDPLDHGTLVAATALGTTNNIGVAPEAQWIACRAIKGASNRLSEAQRCLQWMACPTDPQGNNPKCEMAPRIVLGSFETFSGDNRFESFLSLLKESGIVSIFTVGNEGPECRTAVAPGDSEHAIAIGAIRKDNGTLERSSRGPAAIGQRIKPDVVAPGSNIYTASAVTHSTYTHASGACFAAAHVAGIAALFFHTFPEATVEQFQAKLLNSVERPGLSNSRQDIVPCGPTAPGVPQGTLYPNNNLGFGIVNALRLLNLTIDDIPRGSAPPQPTHAFLFVLAFSAFTALPSFSRTLIQ